MPRLPKLVLLLTTLLLLSFAAPAVSAGTLVIGNGNDLSRYPFGSDPGNAAPPFPDFTAGGTYQQVYASSAFSGPITITQIAFASKGQLTSGPGTAIYDFNVALSTTAVGPGTLSTNLVANRGTDFAQVFTGQVTATLTANNQFDLVINITPFTYDPAQGNLLLEVVLNAPKQFTGGPILYFNADSSSSIGRAANPTGSAGGAFTTSGFGLQTRFTTKATAQVTLGNLLQIFDGSPKSVDVTSDPTGLGVVVTYDGSSTPPTNAGSYAVVAVINDPDFIGQASGNLIIGKAGQQIAFDALPNKSVLDADFNVTATASSNLAVSFAASGDCTLSGNQVHLTGAGSCTITASQDGNANVNAAAPVARTFSIGKADQQITFDALADKKFGDTDFNVSATASSNLAVALSASGNCTVAGTQVHITAAGSCTISASQDGDSIYNPATAVAQTFTIGKADQQITFDALTNKTFADADFSVSATASSNLTVSFAADGNCALTGNQVHLTGAGLCTITASQDGDANINAATPVARTFSIGKADQQITFDALVDRKFGDADFSVGAASSSNLAVSFAANGNCTLNGNQVHLTGAGACTITASQPGDDNYNTAATVSQSFTINKATAVITLDNLAQSYDGAAKSATATTNPAGLGVTITYSQNGVPVTSPTNAGSYAVTAIIDDANHEGSASGTLVIGKATPTINWNNPSDITYGTALSATQLNATASVAGTFVYTPSASQVLHAGNNQNLHVDFTPTDDVNYNSVSKDVAVNVLKNRLTITAEDKSRAFGAANPQLTYSITGFAGNDTQAGATAGQPALSTTATANSDAGNYPITASVGTLSSNDYSFTFIDGTLTVTKADQSIAFGPLANKIFGDAPFAVSATGEASGSAVTFSSQTPAACSVTGNTVTILSVGTCTIRASQMGSSNHNAAADVEQSFDIAKAVTTTTLASSVNPSSLGQAVTFTATVTSAAGVPSGAVQFIIDGVNQGKPRALNSLGITSGSTDILTAGNHTVTAEYVGDTNFASSTGALAVEQVVNIATSININDVSLSEGNSGTKSFDFTVTLSQPSNVVVQVDFATSPGTAIEGADYQSTTGTLTFAPGELSKTITVAVNGNTSDDPNKTFFVSLTNPQNANIIDGQGTGTILNDDAPGVQFSSDKDSFSEGVGQGEIIVTRTGDLSRPMTVEYQTGDQSGLTPCQISENGLASDRCDYATAVGILRFAAGEESKTISIPVINDAYVEPDETFTITLRNAQGGSLGVISTATVTIQSDDVQTATTNPIDDQSFFIKQQYVDFLGRVAEPAGFEFWMNRMNNCPQGQICDRIDTSQRFFQSDEFQERGFYVYRLYDGVLGGLPKYAEFVPDVARLNGSQTPAEQRQGKDAYLLDFINKQAFRNLYGAFISADGLTAVDATGFVNALCTRAGITPASKQTLIDNLQNRVKDPAHTLEDFILTPEMSNVGTKFYDRGFITMQYFGYLRRDPEQAGFDFWQGQLIGPNAPHKQDYRFMVGGFLQSDEYNFRFALLSLAQ